MKDKPQVEELSMIAAMIHRSFSTSASPTEVAQRALALWEACHKLSEADNA